MTVSVVVSAVLSTSATDTPAIGRVVSSLTLCAPGTVFTGGSFTAIIWTSIIAIVVAVPSFTVTWL